MLVGRLRVAKWTMEGFLDKFGTGFPAPKVPLWMGTMSLLNFFSEEIYFLWQEIYFL